jgi:tripartite-type tricarboxylate transporter receptor subunit TctC
MHTRIRHSAIALQRWPAGEVAGMMRALKKSYAFRGDQMPKGTAYRVAVLLSLWTAAVVAHATPAKAQDYPDRPIRIIVPLAPGGTTDSVSRLVADGLSARLGKAVIVENRPGGGTQVGMEAAMKSPADGYTLAIGSIDSLGALPVMKKIPPFDPLKDFTPVSQVAISPLAYAVNASFPPNTMAELVAYAKSRPGEVRYGSPGPGTVLHLGVEWLESQTGIQMTHVPYRGGGPMMQGVVAGEVHLSMTSPDFARNFMDAGKLKTLAQADRKRHVLLPDVPTTAEAGFPDLQVVAWFGIVGPAGMPKAIVDRLAREIEIVLKDPNLKTRMETVGSDPAFLGPDDYTKLIADEHQKWAKIVADAKIPLQD